jgi:hypothetical protein
MKNLILTLAFGLISLVSYSQNSPVLVIGNETYDFGKIEHKNDTLVAHFWFKNQGIGELKMLSTKASCGCIVANFPETTPGMNGGEIVVKYFSANPGSINKSVTITTNDTNNSVVTLRIKGETYKPE